MLERDQIEKVFYTSKQGLEVFLMKDGSLRHAKLAPGEGKELKIKVRAHKSLKKICKTREEYNELEGIPYYVQMDYVKVWEEIFNQKLKGEDIRKYLLDLKRYYDLTWRG